MSMCRVISCVVGRGYLLWPVCSLGKTLNLCPASFCSPRPNLPVIPGISCLPTFAFQSSMMTRTSYFGVNHLVMSMCKVFSCVFQRGCLLWPVCSLGKTCYSPLPCFIPYSKAKFAYYLRCLLTSYFCIPVPYNYKDIFLGVSSKRSYRSS